MATVQRPVTSAKPGAAESDATSPLRAYVVAKQAIAQLLREIQQLSDESAPWTAERVHDLTVRLAEDRFQLVVVGQFKRGKTSLMNAIVRRPLLPTGSIPVTSAVTSLRFGTAVRATIRRSGFNIDQVVSLDELPGFITERGNPGNKKGVLSADVEVPAAFLRRGLRFIDTPGIGSAHELNTATTLAFLPEADAAIFVTGADAPLSEGELHFLDAVRQHVRKLFFVLNKIDQLTTQELDEVMRYTAHHLASRLGIESVRLFPVSAARVLAATPEDHNAVAASGLPDLEAGLATFMTEDRQRTFLVAVLDRTIRLLEDARLTLTLRQRSAAPSTGGDQKTAELRKRYDEQDQQRHALVERAGQLVEDWVSHVLDPSLNRFTDEARTRLSAEAQSAAPSWSGAQPPIDAGRSWLNARLEQSAQEWLRSISGPIDALMHGLAKSVQPEIAHLVSAALQIAASVFGVSDDRRNPEHEEDECAWNWTAPVFEPPTVLPPLVENARDSLILPLPHALAARRARHRLEAALPKAIGNAILVLRDIVLGHLRECIDDFDATSSRALDQERQRVARVLDRNDHKSLAVSLSLDNILARLQGLLSRVTGVRDALLQQAPVEEVLLRAEPAPTATKDSESDQQIHSLANTAARHVVTRTCAICAAVSDAVFDFLCHHQYAIAVDRLTQRQFLASNGLCATHTWHLERIASPRGLSVSYPPLVEATAARLLAIAEYDPAQKCGKALHHIQEAAARRQMSPATCHG